MANDKTTKPQEATTLTGTASADPSTVKTEAPAPSIRDVDYPNAILVRECSKCGAIHQTNDPNLNRMCRKCDAVKSEAAATK